jgi:hypothetical protein
MDKERREEKTPKKGLRHFRKNEGIQNERIIE